MKVTPEHNGRIAKMTFSAACLPYGDKVEKKDRIKEELCQVILDQLAKGQKIEKILRANPYTSPRCSV